MVAAEAAIGSARRLTATIAKILCLTRRLPGLSHYVMARENSKTPPETKCILRQVTYRSTL